MVTCNESGSFHLPMALSLALIMISSVGVLYVLHDWRSLVETQLRLDRCAGEAALELKGIVETLDSTNLQITALRAAAIPASLTPATKAASDAAIEAEVVWQDFKRLKWQTSQALWLARIKCGNSRDFPAPLPGLDLTRLPPDNLGQQPLTWTHGEPRDLHIEIRHQSREAAAHVFKGAVNVTSTWTAEWTVPSRFAIRPGID
jgi:hypothetical protein